jgi:hypothetical protein
MIYWINNKSLDTIPQDCTIVKFPADYGFIDIKKLYAINSIKMCGIVKDNQVYMAKKSTFIILYNKINKGQIEIEDVFNKTENEILGTASFPDLNHNFKLTDSYIRMDLFDKTRYVYVESNKIYAKDFIDIISHFETDDCKTLRECLKLYFAEKASK